jgi:cytochrome c553
MRRLSILVALIFAASIVAGLAALDDGSALAGQRTFVGAAKCKTCHKKPENGEQFKIWSESAHAKAYATLASEEAKKIAADKGIEDPQKADECLSCHVTGHGVAAEFLGKKYAVTDGVGCESCHGAGGDYYQQKTMMAITAGETDRATVGLVKPDEKVCTGCHNDKSPSFKSFDFAEMSKKIAHPIPEGAERKGSGSDKEEE